MGYELRAVIAAADLLSTVTTGLAPARPAPLRQGLSLLPMTAVLFDAVRDPSASSTLGFWHLPAGFDRTLAAWSSTGPVAYVEADYFGGTGEQLAAVWADGRLALGPLHKGEKEPFPPEGSPISQALRRLGATADGEADEFAAVGLHRHRQTRDWATDD